MARRQFAKFVYYMPILNWKYFRRYAILNAIRQFKTVV